MSFELVKTSARIFGGSAVAGMGFSFGRDLYHGAKKNETVGRLIGLIVFVALVAGVFVGGVWIGRNYRSVPEAIGKRLGGILIAVPGGAFAYVWGWLFMGAEQVAASVPPITLCCLGIISGLAQRKRRRLVWAAEDANQRFLAEHGLVENEDSTIEDKSDGQRYRIEEVEKHQITLFPLRRRGKRAYITVGPDGKYSDYTGMVHI